MAPTTRKVLIFGRTGAGKSTLGNMLIAGSTDGPFDTGNSMHPVTDCYVTRENSELSYQVTDTVGLRGDIGDSTERKGSASVGASVMQWFTNTGNERKREREVAESTIRRFLQEVTDAYHHVLFVKRAGRQDTLDAAIWKLFLEIFRDEVDGDLDIYRGIVVVVTCVPSPDTWLQQNTPILSRFYSEVRGRFVAVDFPHEDPNSIVEAEISKRRQEHLQSLLRTLDDQFTANGSRPAFRSNYSTTNQSENELFVQRIVQVVLNTATEAGITPEYLLKAAFGAFVKLVCR